MLAGNQRILDFLPLSAPGSPASALRALLDLPGLLLMLLILMWLVMGLLVAAGVALWRGRLRRMASSLLAVAAIPVCFAAVARSPWFDPWLWYTIANAARFEALATPDPPPDGAKYALVETRDVSTGLAGVMPAHFVSLIYDESDAAGLEPSERPGIWRSRTLWPGLSSRPIPIPRGTRLYGHFYKVDEFL
jgi:hypothetical protein